MFACSFSSFNRRISLSVLLLSLFLTQAQPIGAKTLRIAFLAAESSLAELGPHNRGAWDTAQELGEATLLRVDATAGFVDASGAAQDLLDFDVVWYHQGDAIARSAVYGGAALKAIQDFSQGGGGVLLSGGALAMVAQLGLAGSTRAQRRELEQFRDPAAMVPVETDHPVFEGLEEKEGLLWMSRGGPKAVADFYWGGPSEGMLLANTPAGVQRPLVEYTLGRGRLIVFGWLWPDYADLENPFRSNLLRLTDNMLQYLAMATYWRPVITRTKFPALAFPEEAGIAPARWRALRMAIEDMATSFPEEYTQGADYLQRLNALEKEQSLLLEQEGSREAFAALVTRFEALQREALLANPLLDFEEILFLQRRASKLGLPLNFNGNTDLAPTGYENTLRALAPFGAAPQVRTLYTPEGDRFIGDLELHYDAEKLLLSTPDAQGRWGIAELSLATQALTPLTLINDADVHNYDACYLPDERIVFSSTAPIIGVPCVGGRSKVANLYLRDFGGAIRRMTHDQDHNWCPTVLNNGRVLYQRWEYADIAHAFTRLLFHCNPDGSRQMEYYGSNSFWPTAMFFARPVPGHPTKIVAVVGGHHDAPRQGELVIFDPALGRQEANGAVQRIPGYGEKIEPVILDGLIAASWPRFLHPFPLSEKHFLVSCKPAKTALWGIYLVDAFDNFVLLHEAPGWAMLEPIPWRKTQRQPLLPDSAVPGRQEATVLLTDIYRGPGLAGVPRGAVKALRLAGYDFTFHGFGAEPDRVGLDGPWDVRRILGSVPVEPDGSANFTVPALTPISIQPLDAEGKALALMRSWLTATPGEVVSCVGCHEKQNMAGPHDATPQAFRRESSPIKPWYGPARGFSFMREVQPVLDAYCIRCHDGAAKEEGAMAFDLRAAPAERVPSAFQMHFSPSYMHLRSWVHTPTLESDAHLLSPMDFHADTSKVVQLLRDDHYGVRLDQEAWDRLITWIDLNAPFHGTWKEAVASNPTKLAAAHHGAERRRALHRRYAGIDEDPEAIYPAARLEAIPPAPPSAAPAETSKALEKKTDASAPADTDKEAVRIELTPGVFLDLVRIPAGAFSMGSDTGYPNEAPAHACVIEKDFLIARCEISNRQYQCFDSEHDSGLETGEVYQFGDDERGFPLNRPDQPVVRVSWNEAMAFCAWLSEKTGAVFSLPSEAQWEYACRAGMNTPLSYGGLDDDFSAFANLSDATHHSVYYPHVPTALPPWRPADTRFDDGCRVAAHTASFAPNPWGLYDMHGNVSEWTASDYALYSDPDAGRQAGHKVVRGGSWMDRPKRARAAFRNHYKAEQGIHDVGFRVVCKVSGSECPLQGAS